jgi:hypothetical protein
VKTTKWFRHSRRIDPISRSAYAFCHGLLLFRQNRYVSNGQAETCQGYGHVRLGAAERCVKLRTLQKTDEIAPHGNISVDASQVQDEPSRMEGANSSPTGG